MLIHKVPVLAALPWRPRIARFFRVTRAAVRVVAARRLDEGVAVLCAAGEALVRMGDTCRCCGGGGGGRREAGDEGEGGGEDTGLGGVSALAGQSEIRDEREAYL
jgi:hypothetical protein